MKVRHVNNMEEEEGLQLVLNPDWMSRLPVELHNIPLWNLAIPGKQKQRKKWAIYRKGLQME